MSEHSSGPIEQAAIELLGKENNALRKEVERLGRELKLTEHKVLTCGVAASHPDPDLTRSAGYAKWDSPQAEKVRILRSEVARLTEDLRCARAEVDNNRCAMRSVREAHQEVERLRGALRAIVDTVCDPAAVAAAALDGGEKASEPEERERV